MALPTVSESTQIPGSLHKGRCEDRRQPRHELAEVPHLLTVALWALFPSRRCPGWVPPHLLCDPGSRLSQGWAPVPTAHPPPDSTRCRLPCCSASGKRINLSPSNFPLSSKQVTKLKRKKSQGDIHLVYGGGGSNPREGPRVLEDRRRTRGSRPPAGLRAAAPPSLGAPACRARTGRTGQASHFTRGEKRDKSATSAREEAG